MSDDIHKTHFTVPEMPYKQKEKQAIKLLRQIIMIDKESWAFLNYETTVHNLLQENDALVDWVMKYKGE